MKVLVIIPAYNEELNINSTINNLINTSKKELYTLDYIVINDGSTDNTKAICEKNNINVINLVQNLGIGGAVQTGYRYAYYNNYDIAIQFDGDGQHDAHYIDNLINEVKNGNNLVIGSRFIESKSEFKSTISRRLGIKILSFLIKIFTHLKITDPTSGFRAADRAVIKEFINYYPTEYPEPESLVYLNKKGYKIKEIPVKMHARKFGKSSINFFKSGYYMFSVSIAIIATCIFGRKDKKL